MGIACRTDLTVPCCDICDPSLLARTRPGRPRKKKTTKMPKRGLPHVDAQLALRRWRASVFARDHATAQYDPTAILADTTIEHLASLGKINMDTLAVVLEPHWVWWPQYHEELMMFISNLDIPFKPRPSKLRKRAAGPEEDPRPSQCEGPTPKRLRPLPDAEREDAQCRDKSPISLRVTYAQEPHCIPDQTQRIYESSTLSDFPETAPTFSSHNSTSPPHLHSDRTTSPPHLHSEPSTSVQENQGTLVCQATVLLYRPRMLTSGQCSRKASYRGDPEETWRRKPDSVMSVPCPWHTRRTMSSSSRFNLSRVVPSVV